MQQLLNISILFNPNSTGASHKLATQMCKQLKRDVPGANITIAPTEYAGHAEVLAYDLARKHPGSFIISSSGDGGYHEVINGLMKAKQEEFEATAGLLPGGNANDHYHSLHRQDFLKAVQTYNFKVIDLLRIETTVQGKPYRRYAHSYVGLGLTPRIGKELTKASLNRFNEIWIIIKTFFQFRYTPLTVNGRTDQYQSLICSNIPRMAKVLTLSNDAQLHDGKFEISSIKRQPKWRLLLSLGKGIVGSFSTHQQAADFTLQTVEPTLVQMDGEAVTVDANSRITITCEPSALRYII